MTQIEFTKNDQGWYEATISGFSGTLQVDRYKAGLITIYGKTADCKEVPLFHEYSEATLQKVNLAECITIRIECDGAISKAQYEAE